MNTPTKPFEVCEPLLSDVKLIGTGGAGGIVARYLALFFASLDLDTRLVLVDGDVFEPSNASRMYYGGEGNKARVVRDDLLRQLGESRLSLEAVEEFLTEENISRIVGEGDIVLLTVDNHHARDVVSRFCASDRDDICLVSAGADGVEIDEAGRGTLGTAGNCQIYIKSGGKELTPRLTDYHPEIAEAEPPAARAEGCAAMVQSVPQLLFANLMTASALLNALWLYLCGALGYPEVVFDIAQGRMRPVELPVPRRRERGPAASRAGGARARR